MYVAIEGIDTCGKSTQIELLKAHFCEAIFTKEPGGSTLGEKIRDMVLFAPQREGFVLDERAELLLFLADRAQHYGEILKNSARRLVISDRSVISGIAYAKGVSMEEACWLNRFALRDMLPDLVVILELERGALEQRLGAKTQDSIESRGVDYMLEVQSRLTLAAQSLGLEMLKLDASAPREEICHHIYEAITSRL